MVDEDEVITNPNDQRVLDAMESCKKLVTTIKELSNENAQLKTQLINAIEAANDATNTLKEQQAAWDWRLKRLEDAQGPDDWKSYR